jgi:hypothetical protein
VPPDLKPGRLTLRVYNVGIGDCFLLTFHYSARDRHVLIDFGATSENESRLLLRIAKDISRRCCGKLDAVVATHRHRDHINGFAGRSGDIIAACHPEVVVQPWTERPGAPLGFIGEDHLQNAGAVKNLQRMGRRHHYARYGDASGLESVLPGVTVRVLGPPDLRQTQTIRKQRQQDRGEFWLSQQYYKTLQSSQAFQWGRPPGLRGSPWTRSSPAAALFPRARTCSPGTRPPDTRWFLTRMRAIRAARMQQLVRALDAALNNTSLILLFQAGNKKLLFPGDAQIESWSYALSQPGVRKKLADVDLYKVGHHASRNATPKTLWSLFTRRGATPSPGRLRTVVSTAAGWYPDVPRAPLIETLKAQSDYFSTEDMGDKLYQDISLKL